MTIFEKIDQVINLQAREEDDERQGRREIGVFWPSAASTVTILDDGSFDIDGACARAEYYAFTGVAKTNDIDPRYVMARRAGKDFENQCARDLEYAGILLAREEKFRFTPSGRDFVISGACDFVVNHPDLGIVGMELKTAGGAGPGYHFFTKPVIVGGMPKRENLLQVAIYLDWSRTTGRGLNTWVVAYMERGSFLDRREFIVTLDGDHPVVDGRVDTRVALSRVYDRYTRLHDFVRRGETPPRDFRLAWDAEEVYQRRRNGVLSDAAVKRYERGEPIGDHHCTKLCQYADRCHGIFRM